MTDVSDRGLEELLRNAEARLVKSEQSSQEPPRGRLERLSTDRCKQLANTPLGNNRKSFSVRKPSIAIASKAQPYTAGDTWFGMPKTHLSSELRRDLQILRLRSSGILDPKRFYKKDSGRSVAPKYSHTGTVIEGPTEFFSSRLIRKDRRLGLMDEILDGEKATGRLKEKSSSIAARRSSGKKGFYKNFAARKRRGRR